MKIIFTFFFLFIGLTVFTQDIPWHTVNKDIYLFLDELAANKIIDLNSAIKPYSRKFIAEKLKEADANKNALSARQQKEIEFYLRDFGKELDYFKGSDNYISRISSNKLKKRIDMFYYKDSLFTLTVNPVFGGKIYVNDSGQVFKRWSGAEAYATIGKHWAFYANLRDVNEDRLLISSTYLTDHEGASYKGIDNNLRQGIDYSEMRGGVSYSWSWGSIGFMKDHVEWGTNYHGANILSGHSPSYALIKLKIKPVAWFDFNYVHGWLSSRVVDSTMIYKYGRGTRAVFVSKYLTANMLTITPFKKLHLSFGNSVIYAEKEYPHYIIPLLFYKSVDHSTTLNNNFGTNAQMFFDISSRQIKHVHLYTSVFIDEVGISRMWDPVAHSNFFSLKAGFAVTDLGLKNITLTSEFTRTNPLTYQHFLPVTTFASSDYNLGHYLRDNSDEIFCELRYKPMRGLQTYVSYTHARHGDDFVYGSDYGKYKDRGPWGLPFMENVTWQMKSLTLGVSWQFLHDMYMHIEFTQSATSGNVVKYTPTYLHGNLNTVNAGLTVGF